jgi:hypothetical protein
MLPNDNSERQMPVDADVGCVKIVRITMISWPVVRFSVMPQDDVDSKVEGCPSPTWSKCE